MEWHFPKSPLARVNGLFVCFCANEEYKEEDSLHDDGQEGCGQGHSPFSFHQGHHILFHHKGLLLLQVECDDGSPPYYPSQEGITPQEDGACVLCGCKEATPLLCLPFEHGKAS